MKKTIGVLNGMPIVVGDSNIVTSNEIYYENTPNGVMLYKRGSNGKLAPITVVAETEVPTPTPMNLDDNSDNDNSNDSDTNTNILDE